MPDRYTYPGTEVLINLPGYTRPEAWKAAETATVAAHMFELYRDPLPGDFDLDHLRAIHQHLTQDMYSWGGSLRETDTGPGGTGIAHCRPEFIPAEAERIFTALSKMDLLSGRDLDSFSAGLAWVWGETTVLHPFRDVNTRSQFVFFNQLATHAGWTIDWTSIDPYVFAHARTVAIVRDETGIEALLHPALIPLDEATRHDELRDRLARSRETFFTPRQPRSPTELDAELDSAMHRRSEHLPQVDSRLAEALEERRSKLPPPESFGLGSGRSNGRQPPSLGR